MPEMTPPKRIRWRNGISRAEGLIEQAICELDRALEANPESAHQPGESKQSECDALAAECTREAIGTLRGAIALLASAGDHENWERRKDIRNAEFATVQAFRIACPNPECRAEVDKPCAEHPIVCAVRIKAARAEADRAREEMRAIAWGGRRPKMDTE
jgi:hypothetical protein